jgi:hypothetical protein
MQKQTQPSVLVNQPYNVGIGGLSDVTEPSALARALEYNSTQLDALHNLVCTLKARLSDVLLPETENGGADQTATPALFQSPTTELIRKHSQRVENIQVIVQDILTRLEV